MLTVNPTDNPSFKAVYVIQVRQTAFTNPKDIKACKRQVNKTLGGSGSRISLLLMGLLGRLFEIKQKNKIMTHKIGELIEAQEKEGYHTFSVITGKEADTYINLSSLPHAIFMMNALHRYENDLLGILESFLKDRFRKEPSQNITVETLNELKAYAGKV